jgi:hypothetical protein
MISRIYKKVKKLNTKRINNLISKWANEFNRQFLEEFHKYMNKSSSSLAIKEM